MESNSNFINGMNSDISKLYQSKDTYLQALNFRPIGDLGGSNGSLVNIKGNECKISFPTLQPVYKLKIVKGSVDTLSNNISITINGFTYGTPFTLNNNTQGIDLYNYIVTNYTQAYQNTTNTTKTFSIAYEDDYLVFYQQPVYTGCSPVSSIDTTISISYSGSTNGEITVLNFINSNGVNTLTQDKSFPYVKGSNNLITIGSTFILDDFYLLVAPDDNSYGVVGNNEVPAHDMLRYNGSIWKLTIDDITKDGTLTLVYSNNLDFTKYHPIPPSAITGRYESQSIQRIYWSDNYNKIRTLNVTQQQLMAFDPSLLSVQPNTKFTQPILNAIIGGSLVSGAYQLAYRLSKTLGSVTNISELSNPVYLNTSPEGSAFQNYEGTSGNTSKGIRWKLDGLDTTYDNIEFMVVRKATADSTPTIVTLGTQTIAVTGSMTIDVTDITGETPVTLEEFLLFNGTFTHAKTVDTKDNRLFWGNVRAVQQELTSFDTRAFRANDSGNIVLKNNGVSNNYATVNLASALPETSDTINEYYDVNGDYSSNACYLKPSTALTTKILGGEGLYISYEFGTKSIQLDNNMSISSSDNWNVGTPSSPYRSTDLTGSVSETLIYDYPQNNKFEAMKQPERTSLFRGFQHEEIYRFGIQFFDKQHNPFFVKWIGDIKMPSYGDYNNNPDSIASGAGIQDFRLTYSTSYRNTYGQVLYIKFKMNLALIQDIIGGYEIVRVKRDSAINKTIWGVGLVNPFHAQTGNDLGAIGNLPASWDSRRGTFGGPPPVIPGLYRYYTPYPSQESVETLNIDTDTQASASNFSKFKMFDSFDFDAGFTPNITGGDKLLIRSRLAAVNYRNNGGDNSYRVFFFDPRNYDSVGNPVPPNNQPIDNGASPPFAGSTNYDAPSCEPFHIMKMLDNNLYSNYQSFLAKFIHDYKITEGAFVAGNTSWFPSGGYELRNYGEDVHTSATPQTSNPCYGKKTLMLVLGNDVTNAGLYSSSGPSTGFEYFCTASNSNPFYKLLALYYKPNSNLYGGATYVARTNNEYIPCGEYVSIDKHINTNFITTYGGDVFTQVVDMMKTVKGAGSEYTVYEYNSGGVPQGLAQRQAKFSTSFYFPCTGVYNSELRQGLRPNRYIIDDGGYGEDQYIYEDFNNSENDVKKYFPKPLNYQSADEWKARVYFSEIKFDNETQDSWTQYLTNSYHDCETTYGGINALITLNDQMYYIQDRAIGMLLINPVATVDGNLGEPVQLGVGQTIQKHNNIAIDVGTSHQWSVYRSQSQIIFFDVRTKKLYLFNGSSLNPVSDKFGQRNFFIKRFHDNDLITDNPVIDKGIVSTYDYFHNEFLVTINNLNNNSSKNENYTLVLNEQTGKFSSNYSFLPNIYINNNKYLISNVNRTTNLKKSLFLHNYGQYGVFYNQLYPSTLKVLLNDNPIYTKVFDNLTWVSECIKDNIEWSDDLNIYPGAITNPSYPDDVNIVEETFDKIRCYNQYQNTDFVNLTTTGSNINLRKSEQGFNLQIPRNKFNYDTNPVSTSSLFDPSKLTKTSFGERLRDKWLIVDLNYPNTNNNRFIIHNLKTLYRISDR